MTRNNKDMIGKTFGFFFTFFTCCVETRIGTLSK